MISWHPVNSIRNNDGRGYAVIMLNHSVDKLNSNELPELLMQLWNKAKLRVSVDGGTNYLMQSRFSLFQAPHIVLGDFDSIKPEILDHFRKQNNVKVIETPDQNETDFTKAVREILKVVAEKAIELERIIVLWSTDGRFDHIMSIVNTLHIMIGITETPLFLYDINNSLSWLLKPGEHTIESNAQSEWCALIPVGEPCIVTTQGLCWNLNGDKLAFGSLISTSNKLDFEKFKNVKVNTDKPLLWSMDISKVFA